MVGSQVRRGRGVFDTSLQETLNRESDIVAGAMKYALTPFTTIVLKADRSKDRFEVTPVRDADTLRVTPGVEFNPHALISGSAYVGVRRSDTKSEALEDFNGLVANVQLAWTLLGRTAFIVSAARDVTYSFEQYQPYFVDNSYSLTLQHRLAGKFDVMGGIASHQYSYEDFMITMVTEDLVSANPSLDLLAGKQRIDTSWSYLISVGYFLGPDAPRLRHDLLNARHQRPAVPRLYCLAYRRVSHLWLRATRGAAMNPEQRRGPLSPSLGYTRGRTMRPLDPSTGMVTDVLTPYSRRL